MTFDNEKKSATQVRNDGESQPRPARRGSSGQWPVAAPEPVRRSARARHAQDHDGDSSDST